MSATLALALLLLACGGPPPARSADPAPRPAAPTGAPPKISYRIVATHPHDPRAFTQGLLFHDGRLYESTGQYGQSSLREVEIETGKVLRSVELPQAEFGEGLALAGERLYQLTWRNGRAHVWDLTTLRHLPDLAYDGEGWGLATAGGELVQSDGSAELVFRSPESFAVTRRVAVRRGGSPQFYLNELEWIDGAIWANIWLADEIVRIDPASGAVTGVLDASALLTPEEAKGADVLNGIAWDPARRRLFLTGKDWPKLFEIELDDPLGH